MKKTVLSFLVICIAITTMQAQNEPVNPFEEFGYKPKIATLSKGKYVEFYDQDTIVQIGGAVFNTVTMKIMGFVEYDTIRNEYNISPEVISRWLSPDPLTSEFPSWSPYNYVENNPINLIDPTGLAPESPDEWAVNVETGQTEWMSDKGGDEVQIINYTNNNGNSLGVHTIEGSQAYVGKTRDGWVASKNNLWEGLSESYNTKTGYEYSYEDLKMRHWILNSPKSYDGFATAIKNSETAGEGDPITGNEYWRKYGHTLGNMKLMKIYVLTADQLLSATDGINGMKRTRTTNSFKNFNFTPIQKSVPSTFSKYLQSRKGFDIGKYKGRGEWMKQQAIQFNKLKKY